MQAAAGGFDGPEARGVGRGPLGHGGDGSRPGLGQVDATAALGGHGARQRVGGAEQQRLDLVGAQLGTLGEQEGDEPRRDRRGLRGARTPDVAGLHQGARVAALDGRAEGPAGHQAATRCDQVGLVRALGGRAPRGPGGDAVVGRRRRAVVVVGADGQHDGVVARLGDRPGLGAVVAGGDHDDDALVPQPAHGVVQRVDGGVLGGVGAPGQVEDPDAVLVGVGGDPVHGLQQGRDVGDAVLARHLDRHDVGGGGDAGVGAAGATGAVHARAGDEAGHHGAVAEAVDDGALARQVRAVDDPPVEVGHLGDARVDDGDADPGAEVPAAPGLGGAGGGGEGGGRAGLVVLDGREPDPAVGADGGDGGVGGEGVDGVGVQGGGHPVDQGELGGDAAAEGDDGAPDLGGSGAVPALDDHGDGPGRRRGQRGVDDGGAVGRQGDRGRGVPPHAEPGDGGDEQRHEGGARQAHRVADLQWCRRGGRHHGPSSSPQLSHVAWWTGYDQ